MSPSTTPADVALAYLDAFGDGDVDSALGLLSQDVIWHVDGAPGVPTVGLRQGRDRVAQWIADFPSTFEPRGGQIFTVTGHGDEAVVCGRFHLLVRATGRTVEGDYAIRFTVRDGKIGRYQIFEDSLALAAAFDTGTAAFTAPPQARQVRVNDTVYGYDDTGSGPVVVFLHGLFADRSMFAAQIRALSDTHRCIGVDLPGHGASTWPAGGWTLDDIAADIALLIQESHWGPVVVVGQSQGGMIAMRLAARRPDLVRSLVLTGTSARPEPAERHDLWRRRRSVLDTGTAEQRHAVMREVQEAATDPRWRTANPATAAAELNVMVGHDPAAMALALDAAVLHRPDIRHLLPGIQAPTLVVAGANDRAMPVELSNEIAELIPAARLRLVPDAAHHLPLEASDQVTGLITRFLADHPSPRS
ncbi:hypothetical protein GCM10010486_65870 [Nonomuraea roseoviolacea subsp. carminata]